MAEVEERRRETVVNGDDRQVTQERVSSESSVGNKQTLSNIVWYIAGVILALLVIRFVLKLAGANPSSGFVEFIYGVSGIFVAPFTGIFSTPTAEGDVVRSVFETATVVAIIVYALVAWGISRLFTLNQKPR